MDEQNENQVARTDPLTPKDDEGWAHEIPEQFHVRDDQSANWVVRKIVECRAYSQRCTEWCEREQARAKHDEEFFLFRFGHELMAYARSKMAEQGGRRKSVALPAGAIGFRSVPAQVVVDDVQAVISWAKVKQPELVTVIEQLSKSGFTAHVKSTGEMPDSGAHIEPEREKFYVK